MPRVRRTLTASDFERMNLPKEFWTAKVQKVAESVRDTINRYLVHFEAMADRGAGLLISGAAGVGKTGIAALACKEARSLRYTVLFMPVWELREHVKAKTSFDSSQTIMERCLAVGLLVLDGLRAEDARDYAFGSRSIEDLVSSRGSRKLLTIVTTRMTATEMREHLPGLVETAQGRLVYLTVEGPNLRSEQNHELQKLVMGSGK